MTTLSHAFRALSLCLSLCVAACGGDDDSSSSSEASACSAIGFSKSAKVANGEVCSVDSADDTSSVVRVRVFEAGGSESVCTGTVISSTAVLTAAHCFLSSAVGASVVITVNGQQAEIPASRIALHPGFSVSGAGIFFNDAAVIRTSTALAAPTSPILLSRAPRVGEEAIVAGYGQVGNGLPASEDINAGSAEVRDVTSNHVFINFTKDESHPCQGDSGGALFVRDGGELAIVGVVSQSDPSVPEEGICEVGDRTLYTNTQSSGVIDFILASAPDAAVR